MIKKIFISFISCLILLSLQSCGETRIKAKDPEQIREAYQAKLRETENELEVARKRFLDAKEAAKKAGDKSGKEFDEAARNFFVLLKKSETDVILFTMTALEEGGQLTKAKAAFARLKPTQKSTADVLRAFFEDGKKISEADLSKLELTELGNIRFDLDAIFNEVMK